MKTMNQIRDLKDQIFFLREELFSDNLTIEERKAIVRKIDDLRDLIDALKGACE
ncbi:MAG: hypothetical protein JRE18_03440 [Deltaproteobacteria bacterium]|jgi:hypothetical protein|nr:hypothetical protein [Deltaproteobacteria bacterium]